MDATTGFGVIVPGPEWGPWLVGHDAFMGKSKATERRVGLQPQKCAATSKSTGARCRQWAVVGARVCHYHGGSRPDVRANGELRAVAEQIGAAGMPPADTVRLVARALSSQFLKAAATLDKAAAEGRPIDPADVERFESAADKALVSARIALASGVEDAAEARDEEAGQLVATAVVAALDEVLDLVPGLSHEQRKQLRAHGLLLAEWSLRGADPAQRPFPPELVRSPVSVAVGELLPAPPHRRASRDTASDVWRRAQEVVDAEVVDDEEVGDGDESGDPGEAA